MSNDFKPFAIAPGSRVLSQASWETQDSLVYGFATGILTKEKLNKAIRQPSVIAAALAQFIANQTGAAVVDDGDFPALVAQMSSALGGGGGGSGAAAQLITISATGFAFVFKDAASTSTTYPTITFTAYLQNVLGPVTYSANAYDAAGTLLGSVTLGGASPYATLTAAQFTARAGTYKVLVTATVTGTSGPLTDTFSVYRADGGSDALQVRLTNESHTLAASSDGTVSSYAGANGTIEAYKGALRLTSVTVPSVAFSLVGYTGFSTVFPAAQAGISVNTTTGDYAVTAGLAATNATVTIRATLSTGQTMDAVFSLSKSLKGADGPAGTAPMLSLSAPQQAFVTPSNGTTPAPASILVSATAANIPSPSYVWQVDGATQVGATASTFTVNSFPAGESHTVRCTATGSDGSTDFDLLTIYSLKNGDNSVAVGLTNENQTVACDSTGTPKAGGGLPITSQILVYVGAAPVTTGITYTVGTNTGFSGVSISLTGLITCTGITADSASLTVQITYNSINYQKTLTANKSRDGQQGLPGTSTPGAAGNSVKVAYALFTGNPTMSGTSVVTTGASSLPATNSWSPTAVTAWSTTTQTPLAGQTLMRTDGIFDTTTGQITWPVPYLANFKVGQLSAITADIGNLVIGSGGSLISGKTTSTSTGTAGFFLGNEGGTPKFTIGNAGLTKGLLWDGSDLNLRVTTGDGLKFQNMASGSPVALGGLYAQTVLGWPSLVLASAPWTGSSVNRTVLAASGPSGTAYGTLMSGPFNNASEWLVSSPAAGGQISFRGLDCADLWLEAQRNVGASNIHIVSNGSVPGTLAVTTDNVSLAAGGDLKLQSLGAGGQLRLKTNSGSSGYGVMLRNDNTSFYLLLTDSGNADGTWNTKRPLTVDLASGQVTLSNPKVLDASVGTGGATATFVNTNKPGAASSNVWVTVSYNGTLYAQPLWPI